MTDLQTTKIVLLDIISYINALKVSIRVISLAAAEPVTKEALYVLENELTAKNDSLIETLRKLIDVA